MKNECLFTPEQKQVVIDNCLYFGEYFAQNGLKKHFAPYMRTKFKTDSAKNMKTKSSQLGILFAYYLIKKDFQYFIDNKNTRFDFYFSNTSTNGWCGFAYKISQHLKELKSDDEILTFVNNLHKQILNKF